MDTDGQMAKTYTPGQLRHFGEALRILSAAVAGTWRADRAAKPAEAAPVASAVPVEAAPVEAVAQTVAIEPTEPAAAPVSAPQSAVYFGALPWHLRHLPATSPPLAEQQTPQTLPPTCAGYFQTLPWAGTAVAVAPGQTHAPGADSAGFFNSLPWHGAPDGAGVADGLDLPGFAAMATQTALQAAANASPNPNPNPNQDAMPASRFFQTLPWHTTV